MSFRRAEALTDGGQQIMRIELDEHQVASERAESVVGAKIAARFRVVEIITDHPHARTLRGVDEITFEEVIIKLCRQDILTPATRARIDHEAAIRRSLDCEFLPRLLDYGQHENSFFAVWSCFDGISLAERLKQGPLSVAATLRIAEHVCSALRDLHAHGVLHRDIKPDNIITNTGSPLISARLVDIATARDFRPDRLLSDRLLKLVTYMSPEQAGSIDVDVGEASDLYAVGTVLFQCLAGVPPFVASNASTLLFEHLTAPVPDLRAINPAVPRALDELIQRLLRKDPLDRYQLADAVVHDVLAIRREMDEGTQDPIVVIGSTDRRCKLTEPAFVARTDELQQITALVENTRLGKGDVMFVESESGGGKSRLLVEVAKQARRDGLLVLRGQGSTQVGDSPFRLLSGIVDGFLSMVQSDPGLIEAIREKMEGQLPALCAALPSLCAVFNERPNDSSPAAFGETRAIQAISKFWSALGAADRPVTIILDDCQWADELTYKLIQRWRQTRGGSLRHTSLIIAFRSEEVLEGHPLRRMTPASHLRLAPFQPDGIRKLLESMAGALPGLAIDVATRLADGSPFMASAVLRGLVESKALISEPTGWRVEPLAIADVASSRHAGAVLARRIEILPEATIRLLSVGAVVGKEFELDIASSLAGMSLDQALRALAQARERHLIWTRPNGGLYVFVHDQIRAAVLNRFSEPEQKQLHLQAARYRQEYTPDSWSDIAYHFDAGGDARSALIYALQAAKQARERFALEVAERQYRIACRGVEHADSATRFQIAEGLGDTLMLRGQYAKAAPLFVEAEGLAEGQLARAEIQAKLAELSFKRGDMESATTGFERALEILDRPVPTSAVKFVLFLVWEAAAQLGHTLFPKRLLHRLGRPPSDNERLAIRLFSLLTHGYWYTRSKTHCLWAHLKGLNLAERFPPTPELAHAYSEHAPVMCLVPLFQRAIKYAERSLQLRKEFQDVWGQGQSLNFYSCVLYAASRYRECVEKGREAVRLLERTGDYWQVHIARYQVAASLYHLGDCQAAIEECRLNHQSGIELGDEQASGIILDVWASAATGKIPSDIVAVELARKRQDAQGMTQVLLAEGIRNLQLDEIETAVTCLKDAVGVADRAGIQNAYTLPSLAWLATACRRQVEVTSCYAPQQRKKLLRGAERAVRRAIRSGKICRNDLPRALRESAILSAMRGKFRRARTQFDQSLSVAEQQEARFESSETLRYRGQIGQQAGWPDWSQDLAEANRIRSTLTNETLTSHFSTAAARELGSLSLADRFDTLLETGRRIASALSEAKIYEQAHAAMLRLLRGESCLLFEIDPGNPHENPRLLIGSDNMIFDRNMLQASLQLRRAVAFDEELPDDATGAEGNSTRSAISVPIQVRGRTTACLYVTNSHVRGLFGSDEERLADFVATIAGAALENAEGFHKLEVLNATLEQRVAERTAAADAANEAKSRFLATMSHEIRTPMNGIMGMTELTLRTPLSDQQRNCLNVVRQSGDALLTLLNDILDLSKIEAGKMELEVIDYDPSQVVADSARLMGVFAAQKRIELVCRVAPQVPRQLRGDPCRLRQVIVNLIGNAIKFTEAGEVFLDMVTEQGTDGQHQLHVLVRDTGPGIPRDKQTVIFESFSQSDSSTTRRYGGTGLGLAISAQLVDLMAGHMWLDSEVGHGSTFHFAIPILDVNPKSVNAYEGALDGFTVLVASQQATAGRVYQEMLEQAGAEVVVVNSSEALQRNLASLSEVTDNKWRVVVDLDVTRPPGNDCFLEVLHEQLSALPLLILAPANGSINVLVEWGLQSSRCLTKPIVGGDLIDAVLVYGAESVEEQVNTDCAPLPGRCALHILVAEDGEVNQEVAVAFIEMLGHTAEVASSGPEALSAFERSKFDIIFMDLEMPGFDGFDATRLIREMERKTGTCTPIVAMTAHALSGYRELCLAAGMDDFVTKPLNPDVISAVIERYCLATTDS